MSQMSKAGPTWEGSSLAADKCVGNKLRRCGKLFSARPPDGTTRSKVVPPRMLVF